MVMLFLMLTIFINEVMPAPSNAPEWVELYNPGPDAVDLSGWYFDDDTLGGTQITIPPNTVIAPASLYVFTLNSAILNNTGDAITLYNAHGQLIDRIDFASMKNTESVARTPDGSALITKTLPSPGQWNTPQVSPTPLLPTVTAPINVTDVVVSLTPHAETSTTPSILDNETPTPPTTFTASILDTLNPTSTESPTRTPSPTKTPSDTRTPSPTKTPSDTRTPSPTKTPSDTRTPSPTKTPSDTRTPSPTKTASHTAIGTATRTPSLTRTPRLTKTPRSTLTIRATRTLSHTRTLKPSHTAHISDSQSQADSRLTPTQIAIISVINNALIPQLVVCPPPPATLKGWKLVSAHQQLQLLASSPCATITLPENPPPHWQLINPHGLVIAEIDVFQAQCHLDVSTCRPSQTPAHMILHVDPRPSVHPTEVQPPTHTVATTVVSLPGTTSPLRTSSTIPVGLLLMLGGWIALKLLARPADDVLYSEADEDAASSADALSSESRKV